MLSKLKRLRHYSLADLREIAGLTLLLLKAELFLRRKDSSEVLRNLPISETQGSQNKKPAVLPEAWARLTRLLEISDRQHPFKPSCVRKAMVLKEIFEKRSVPFLFRIGIQRDALGIQAHIWMEIDGHRLETPLSSNDFKVLEGIPPTLPA